MREVWHQCGGKRPTVCTCCRCHRSLNTLRPRQNDRHFPDDICKCIFFNENVWISIKISLKFVPKCLINNIPALVLIMAWRRPGDKPLSEPILVRSLTHICVTQPQWVNICTWFVVYVLSWSDCEVSADTCDTFTNVLRYFAGASDCKAFLKDLGKISVPNHNWYDYSRSICAILGCNVTIFELTYWMIIYFSQCVSDINHVLHGRFEGFSNLFNHWRNSYCTVLRSLQVAKLYVPVLREMCWVSGW